MAAVSLADRVAHELVGRVVGAVAAGDVPVEVVVAGLVHLRDDVAAYGGVEVVDAAAREAHERGGVPDLLGDGVTALMQVGPVGVDAGIHLLVFVGVGVDGHLVALLPDARKLLEATAVALHEPRGPHAIFVENPQDALGVCAWTIVEGKEAHVAAGELLVRAVACGATLVGAAHDAGGAAGARIGGVALRGNLEGARGWGRLSGAVVGAGGRCARSCPACFAHCGKIAGPRAGHKVCAVGSLLAALFTAAGEERGNPAHSEDAEGFACLTAGEGSAAMAFLRKDVNLLANLFHACLLPPAKKYVSPVEPGSIAHLHARDVLGWRGCCVVCHRRRVARGPGEASLVVVVRSGVRAVPHHRWHYRRAARAAVRAYARISLTPSSRLVGLVRLPCAQERGLCYSRGVGIAAAQRCRVRKLADCA